MFLLAPRWKCMAIEELGLEVAHLNHLLTIESCGRLALRLALGPCYPPSCCGLTA